jgi:hypothetical protein
MKSRLKYFHNRGNQPPEQWVRAAALLFVKKLSFCFHAFFTSEWYHFVSMQRTQAFLKERNGRLALVLSLGLSLARMRSTQAQDHADYRFEDYFEDAGRIGVQTHSWLFDKQLEPWLSLKGSAVYDAISGATPTGAPPPSQVNFFGLETGPLSTKVPTVHMEDQRWAGALDPEFTFGRHHITPEFSYSSEHDYESYGGALNYAIDLNQKNTTLAFGWAHDWDHILPNAATYITKIQRKDSDDFLVSVSQLLGPKTVFGAAFTFRNAQGYLDDPYRGVLFGDYPQGDPNTLNLFPESRPSHRESYIGYLSLTQFITPAHASIELAYRYYRDSFGIDANTVDLAWYQKIGQRVLVSPQFRYYRQSAASFYATQFPGDPTNPFDPNPLPTYYSSDYRLSSMETFTYGISLSAHVLDWLSLDLAYKRYEMYGLDSITSPSAYPKAHIVTLGARFWF